MSLSDWTPPPPPPPPQPSPPGWRRPRVLLVAGAVALGTLMLTVILTGEDRSPREEAEYAGELFAEGEWGKLHDQLCTLDRDQFTEADLERAGEVVGFALRGVEGFTAQSEEAAPGFVSGPRTLEARRVRGELVAALGPSSPASITLVRERQGWRSCFSAGGYSLAALSLDVAPGAEPVLPAGPPR